jgi:hypothetical protein
MNDKTEMALPFTVGVAMVVKTQPFQAWSFMSVRPGFFKKLFWPHIFFCCFLISQEMSTLLRCDGLQEAATGFESHAVSTLSLGKTFRCHSSSSSKKCPGARKKCLSSAQRQ